VCVYVCVCVCVCVCVLYVCVCFYAPLDAVAHTDAISSVVWAREGVLWTTDIAGVAKRWVIE
jgi:hypothetical protein